MKILKTILVLCFFLNFFSVDAQIVNLDVYKITVNINDQKFDATPLSIELITERSTNAITLFKNNQLEIKAVYTLKKFEGTRRNSLKKTSLQLQIDYVFYYADKNLEKQKMKNFYINNDRTFEESETATFMNGISNTLIKISFTGKLPQ